jgi:hypothetical protein
MHVLNPNKFDVGIYEKYPLAIGTDTSVGIATGCGLDGQGSIPDRGKKISLLHSV